MWGTAGTALPCYHGGELMNDFRNGCYVCLECGLTLNEPVFGDCAVSATAAEARVAFGGGREDYERELRVLREFLHDRLQPELDCTYFIDRIVSMLTRHRRRVPQCPDLLRLNTSRPIDRGVLAYFVWETLNVEGHPCAPQHICLLLDASVGVLRDTERDVGPSTVCTPGQYVPWLARALEIPHGLRLGVAAIADLHCTHLTHRPEIVVGGMLYHLLETRGTRPLDKKIWHVTGPVQLAEAANCSVSSLTSMAKHTLSTACKKGLTSAYQTYRWRRAESFMQRYLEYKKRGTLADMTKARHFGFLPYYREQLITSEEVGAIAEELQELLRGRKHF